jgi:hypothetical protein
MTYQVLSSILAVALLGCGSDGMNTGDVDGGGGGADAATNPGEWKTLIARDWTLAPGTEQYRCSIITVTEDTYITGFRAIDPIGTHHTVVTVQDSGTNGDFNCDPGTLADEMIFASGVGTDNLEFPEGVAFKVEAGRKILLNLHLYNLGDAAINGNSGTEIKTIPAAEVQQEAEVTFAGTFVISLPPNTESSATGRCNFTQDATVMTIWPHMHQLGTHMKVVHEAAAGDVVLHDKAYSFDEQVNYNITPTMVKAGESVRAECTWNNTTGSTVIFGDSSDKEMCFAGLYRYPRSGENIFCGQ